MATIPNGTKFLGIDASVPTPELNGSTINKKTQHYTLEDIAESVGGSLPYKTYRSLLTQVDTSAPTAVVLQNELDGDIVFTRTNTGRYVGTLSGAFLSNKVFISITPMDSSLNKIIAFRATDDTITIQTYSADESAFLDTVLFNTEFQVLVYE